MVFDCQNARILIQHQSLKDLNERPRKKLLICVSEIQIERKKREKERVRQNLTRECNFINEQKAKKLFFEYRVKTQKMDDNNNRFRIFLAAGRWSNLFLLFKGGKDST